MPRKRSQFDLSRLATEQANPAARELDTKSALQIARIINTEDAKVAAGRKARASTNRDRDRLGGAALRNGGR